MTNRTAILGTALVGVPLLWLLTADVIWCQLSPNNFRLSIWLDSLQFFGTDWSNSLGIAASAVVPTAVLILLSKAILRRWLVPNSILAPRAWSLRGGFRRGVVESTTDNYGHAKDPTLAEIRKHWPGPDATYVGGVVIGEVAGQPGRAPLIVDHCREGSTHGIVVAGSGGNKTTSVTIPTLLTWTDPVVVLDPKGELAPMLTHARELMGHRVIIFDPESPFTQSLNSLGHINPNSIAANIDVASVVESVVGHTPTDNSTSKEFTDGAKSLVTALLSDMLWNKNDPLPKTLKRLRPMIADPDLMKRLDHIYDNTDSQIARDSAAMMKKVVKSDRTFGSIMFMVENHTRWLSDPAFANLVSGSFKPQEILDGKTDIFVNLSLKVLESHPSVARAIIGSLLSAVFDADGSFRGRVLFLLEDAYMLRNMHQIRVVRDVGRTYGMTILMLYQSWGQVVSQWGREGARTWQNTASWISYSGKDPDTARELSEISGQYGALAWSHGANLGRGRGGGSSGSSVNYSEVARQLRRVDEVVGDIRRDEQIVVPSWGRPFVAGRAIYFRRPEMVKRVSVNRFVKAP